MKNITQKVDVSNADVRQGKKEYVLGKTLILLGLSIPLVKCGSQTVDLVKNATSFRGFENMQNEAIPFAIAGGVLFGIGAITSVYGRIKHWYYNDRL